MPSLIDVDLPRQRTCAAIARRLVDEHFADELDAGTLDDLKLVVSELVDNAYLHGVGQIRMKLTPQAGQVRVEVLDEGEGAAIKIRALGATGGGHGLRLVDHLCSEWGAFEGSTHVWAELSLDPADRP
ncbi:MAG TPA: ATP-binding protein [Solirubrobacteraceae bacterium]|nr:ATP-binding protein [Solirubrobacteraceae bacterium]